MADNRSSSPVARRSFLARLGAGMGVVGAGVAAGRQVASAQTTPAAFQPVRHAQDDWLDQLPGKHRFVFDTTSSDAIGSALLYANNFFVANQSGYGLGDADAAVVIVARHNSTPFAYSDRIWAKYGTQLAARSGLNDPKTKQAPTVNMFTASLDGLIKRGVHVAVCQMATRFYAGQIAQSVGGDGDAVYSELAANLVGNAHLVAAGIVAVNRAQERGYTLATAV